METGSNTFHMIPVVKCVGTTGLQVGMCGGETGNRTWKGREEHKGLTGNTKVPKILS